jgi:hypothetical protein
MRVRGTLRWIAIAGITALAGSATAQQQSAPPSNGSNAEGQVNMERRVQLSPQDELAQAENVLKRMDAARKAVHGMLEKARADRDVVKTLCLNDKLSQLDVSARSARERKDALQAAVQRNDAELAGHEFTILTVLKQRTDQLSAEANQCIGQEVSFVSQTQIITEVDPESPEVDTYLPPQDPILLPGAQPPICVSCTH